MSPVGEGLEGGREERSDRGQNLEGNVERIYDLSKWEGSGHREDSSQVLPEMGPEEQKQERKAAPWEL